MTTLCDRPTCPGKVAALNSLKGQVMKLSKGKSNPALVGEILERKLKA